ncbi:hypothetical protein C8R45DRAFT_1132796 [Mycena sanguinolenta]|nr:hypothetical protein C8R45DRAFT_1132796 [Mycena sanguinolenta]
MPSSSKVRTATCENWSADPFAAPAIRANYFSVGLDLDVQVTARYPLARQHQAARYLTMRPAAQTQQGKLESRMDLPLSPIQRPSHRYCCIDVPQSWRLSSTTRPICVSDVVMSKARPEALKPAKPGPFRPGQARPDCRLVRAQGLGLKMFRPGPARQARAWTEVILPTVQNRGVVHLTGKLQDEVGCPQNLTAKDSGYQQNLLWISSPNECL